MRACFFLCLHLAVAANDACPGNGKKPKREDRLTRLAQQYNSERCKAAILAEDLPRWISNNAGNVKFIREPILSFREPRAT